MENTRLELYPMKFGPLFREKPWGGFRLRDEFGYAGIPGQPCGEAWLLSAVPGNETRVSNGSLKGNTLSEVYEIFMEELTGEKAYKESPDLFPLLIKIIDAREWLSVQVHPDDDLAGKRHGTKGKTEMWYILDADPEASLISGFQTEIDRSTLVFLAENGLLPDVMHYEKVARHDAFYTPAGRVHAIGPGILLAEIQQTSDVTYRIYDWGRKGADGKPRQMHLSESVDAIDFHPISSAKTIVTRTPDSASPVLSSPWFSVSLIMANVPLKNDYTLLDSCVALLFVKGEGMLLNGSFMLPYRQGELILLPATTGEVEILPSLPTEILQVHIP
jgi:mannose-6-phosphate isomerase